MSALPTCVVCDALLRGYNGNCVCERCKEPCQTCGGDVAHCQHPLRAEQFVDCGTDPLKHLEPRKAA
jgi:hypothetical protein